MLQKLLADRLELKLRRGPEETSVYALVPASLVNLLGVMVDRPVVGASGLTGTRTPQSAGRSADDREAA
jgi:hypothetical protein